MHGRARVLALDSIDDLAFAMARRYVRDAKGRFASKGYSGQTGGRGARLKGSGKKREGGGAKSNLLGSGDQARTSVPKRTIGKTRKLRSRQKVDMTGQEFARFEAGKKAAKADISKRKQETFFKEMQKKLDAAPLAQSSARQAAAKPAAAQSKPTVAARSKPNVTQKGARINPAKQADRASTAKVNRAMSAEKAARSAAFASKDSFSSPARQALNQKLNEATNRTAAEIQTRRNVRASFPVTKKTPTIKSSRPSSTVKAPKSTKAQRDRASRNLARSLDSRGRAVGRKDRRTKKIAERAAQFYSNPMKALKSVTYKGTGFKLPRSLRR